MSAMKCKEGEQFLRYLEICTKQYCLQVPFSTKQLRGSSCGEVGGQLNWAGREGTGTEDSNRP